MSTATAIRIRRSVIPELLSDPAAARELLEQLEPFPADKSDSGDGHRLSAVLELLLEVVIGMREDEATVFFTRFVAEKLGHIQTLAKFRATQGCIDRMLDPASGRSFTRDQATLIAWVIKQTNGWLAAGGYVLGTVSVHRSNGQRRVTAQGKTYISRRRPRKHVGGGKFRDVGRSRYRPVDGEVVAYQPEGSEEIFPGIWEVRFYPTRLPSPGVWI